MHLVQLSWRENQKIEFLLVEFTVYKSLMLLRLKITKIFPWPCFVPLRYEKPNIFFLNLPTLRKKRSKTMNTNKKCTPQRLTKIKLRLLHIFLFFLRKSLTFKNKMFRDSWEEIFNNQFFTLKQFYFLFRKKTSQSKYYDRYPFEKNFFYRYINKKSCLKNKFLLFLKWKVSQVHLFDISEGKFVVCLCLKCDIEELDVKQNRYEGW